MAGLSPLLVGVASSAMILQRWVPQARILSAHCSFQTTARRYNHSMPNSTSYKGMKNLLLPTLRSDPKDAHSVSHKLLVRAGFIRQLGTGMYIMLPLAYRVLQKIERIIDEEMQSVGTDAKHVLTPCYYTNRNQNKAMRIGLHA